MTSGGNEMKLPTSVTKFTCVAKACEQSLLYCVSPLQTSVGNQALFLFASSFVIFSSPLVFPSS